ncbi:diguanylate cyclase [Psychromonas ossibalaenae]|uniref:diguanylate cyclase n=1 Tax=Psychromonas ossibalaenae TaxID=444922 RepID=UPI000381E6CF|nr:diguanylate cyclase [Psychromonas ossibalaenae]
METIKLTVQKYWLEAVDDQQFLDDLGVLAELKGDRVYSETFKLLADFTISPADAGRHWGLFLKHRDLLLNQLNSSINMVALLCDYLARQNFKFTPKITDMMSFEETLNKSTHDELTHLLNRSFFEETLEHQLAQAKRLESLISLLFIDIDDFKEVNDNYGHQAGDSVLCIVAKIIEQEIRQSDFAVRFGGEEFVIVMPNTASMDALILAERIRRNIADHRFINDGKELRLTISGGVTTYPIDADNKEDLIYYADSALYQAKGAGKNCISIYKADKRRYLRIALDGKVRVRQLDFNCNEEYTGISKDIGIGGILFENNCPMDLGTNVQLSTKINNNDPIVLIGTVVRVELITVDRYDIGVALSFKELDKLAKTEIAKVVVKHVDTEDA